MEDYRSKIRVPEDSERDFTAGIFIFKDGEILLLKHRKLDIWVQPGGHVEEGETPDEAAIREAREETGFGVELDNSARRVNNGSIDLPEPFNVNLHRIEEGHWHCDFQYTAFLAGERKKGYEYSDKNIQWFGKDEIEKLEMPENVRNTCLKAFQEFYEE